jgi:hypothetical protein
MAQTLHHFEIAQAQQAPPRASVCGDVVRIERTAEAVWMICCDGVGKGVKAHIAAVMTATRFLTLVRLGGSFREALLALAETQAAAKLGPVQTYTAFSACRLSPDGTAAVGVYEAPGPVQVGPFGAGEIPLNPYVGRQAMIAEGHCRLMPGEALILMSDGITQAGLGRKWANGWETQGVVRYLSGLLGSGVPMDDLPTRLIDQAGLLNDNGPTDDMTVGLAHCRRATLLTVLTGPPQKRSDNGKVVRRFTETEGLKAVCGGTTTEIVAQEMKCPVKVVLSEDFDLTPPASQIEGIDVVTEGVITLNQVYHLLEVDPTLWEEGGAPALARLLLSADRIEFWLGGGESRASNGIRFAQRGLMPRRKIVPLIAARLQARGKIVTLLTV